MVLNEDSTHPNPWKPIPAFQKWWMVEYPVYQIYKKHPEKHTRGYDIFRDEDMADRLGWFIRKATIIGLGLSAYDIYILSRPVGLRNRLARAAFITGPIVAMAASFVASKEIGSNLAVKMGYDRNHSVAYAAAPLGPALVAKACFGTNLGFMIAVWGPLLMVAQKELIDLGYGFVLNDHYDQRLSRFDPNYWKNLGTWKYLDKNDSGPTYKKWLEEEK